MLKHSYYQNYSIDGNQILQKDKDHQVLLMGGTNKLQTNKSKMVNSHPFKNKKNCDIFAIY